jgi:Fis family transcriptional regulator
MLLAAALVMRLPLGPFLDAVSQTMVEGPIVNPAKYMREMGGLLTNRNLAAALARAQHEIRTALEQHPDGRAQLALFAIKGNVGAHSVKYHADRLVVAALSSGLRHDEVLREIKRRLIINVLTRHGGNQTHAARELGIHRNTLERWIDEAGILPADYGRKRRYQATAPGKKRSGPASVTPSLLGETEVAG